jgi:hypothetical protein
MKGNALAIQVERNLYLFRGEKGLLNVLQRKYKALSKIVFDAIRELMTTPQGLKGRAGFHS